jgi:hypothetical protein
MQALPHRSKPILPPEAKLGTGLIEEHHPSGIEPGEESTERPPVVFVAFYGALSGFFLEYLKRLTQRLMVGPESWTPCCS